VFDFCGIKKKRKEKKSTDTHRIQEFKKKEQDTFIAMT